MSTVRIVDTVELPCTAQLDCGCRRHKGATVYTVRTDNGFVTFEESACADHAGELISQEGR